MKTEFLLCNKIMVFKEKNKSKRKIAELKASHEEDLRNAEN